MNLHRHTYNARGEKTIDFVIGFVGWWVVNAIILGISQVILPIVMVGLGGVDLDRSLTDTLVTLLGLATTCLPLLLNVGAVVVFAFTRYWIALGALAAFGAALLVAMCIAIVVGAVCFAALVSYSSMGP